MKGKELIIVLGVAIILLVIIIVGANANKGKNLEQGETNTPTQSTPNNSQSNTNEAGEFYNVVADGTKVNRSPELSKTKTLDGLEISNIRLSEKGNASQLLADVKNTTSGTLGDFPIKITLVDKEGKELATIGGYIDKVAPGETVEINSSASVDVANAYDFKITK